MNIAENYIPEDKDTALPADDSSLSSNDDQAFDLDELSSMHTDEVEVSTEDETPLDILTDEDQSQEEQAVLFDASAEVITDAPQSHDDDIPVLRQYEDLYRSYNESSADNREAVSDIEDSINSNETAGDSVLLELEALLSGDSVGTSTSSITLDGESSQGAEYSSDENDVSAMSALDELNAFLGETASSESSESGDIYTSDDEYYIASRRSILDELQALLQLCIDELSVSSEGGSQDSVSSAQVDYPGHHELKNLLETKLRQLMEISAGSTDTDYISDDISVLDALSSTLGGTERNDTENVLTASVPAEVDAYESSNNGAITKDTLLDELKDFLGEFEGADVDIPIQDPFQELLPESAQVEDSEPLQDFSAISITDNSDTESNHTEVNGNEKSVLEEYAAYMDGSSDLLDIAVENLTINTKKEPVFENADNNSDPLQQLEEMLNEPATDTDNESRETIPLNHAYDSFDDYDAAQAENIEQQKYLEACELRDSLQPAQVETESMNQHAQADTTARKHLPVVDVLLIILSLIGVVVFWSFFDDKALYRDQSQVLQSLPESRPVIVQAEPDYSTQPVMLKTESESRVQEEIKTAENETRPLYGELEKVSLQDTQSDLSDEPTQYFAEPANQLAGPVAETNVLLVQPKQMGNEITENRITELIVQQIQQVEDENGKYFTLLEANLVLLSERLSEAESSISKLQQALGEYEKPGAVRSVASISAEMNAARASKLEQGDVTDQTYTIWSVHLLSYFGKPPPAGELVFLDKADVPYKIKKAIINGDVWYRVLVNNSTEYKAAKQYAEMLTARLGLKEIWISKKQYSYE